MTFVSVQEKLDKLVALTPDDQEKLSHYKSIVPAMIANCHKAHQSIPGWESCKPEIEAFKWFDGINIPVHGYIDLKGDKVIILSHLVEDVKVGSDEYHLVNENAIVLTL